MNDSTRAALRAKMDPQMAAALKKAADIAAELAPPVGGVQGVRQSAALGRKYWNEGGPQMARVEERTIPGPLRDIPVVIYYPATAPSLPVFVYLHGGGYRIGNPHSNDRQMRELAAQWGGIVISADYAHVPEHTFPAPVEETVAVYRWLATNGAAWGIDASRIAFGGSSAGANVSVGAAIQLGGARTGFLKAGVTVSGLLDDDVDTESMRLFDGGAFYPPRDNVITTITDYVPDAAQRKDPRFNMALADPALLPPLFLAAAELDTLRDSSKNLAARLAAAGRPHTLKIYPGMTHVFMGFSRTVERAQECVRDIAGFLAEQLPAR